MNFDDAIAAHAAWKTKLSNYLKNPDKTLSAVDAGVDNKCALGQWIYGEGKVHSSMPEYSTLVAEHAKFHKKASEIIKRADGGEKISRDELGMDSEYGKISSAAITAIIKMRAKAEKK